MKEISFEKTNINRILVLIHVSITILMNISILIIPFVVIIYIAFIACPIIILSSIIFVIFVLLDEQCHLSSYGFWINISGNAIFLIFLIPYFFYIPLVLLLFISLASIGISALLLYYRHEVDKIIIFGMIEVEESFENLDLKTIKSKIPLYRIKRAIQRGIRAEYLDPNFIIDKDILLKCPVLKINKDILYKKMRSPIAWDIKGVHLNIYGVSLIGLSFLWFIVLQILSDFTYVIFAINIALGATVITYHAVQSLHHRKTALIIEQWLRWKKEVDLSKLGREFGYLPIGYSPNELVKIVEKYRDSGVFGEIKINKFILNLV